jgi:hypothetical protein
MFPEALGGLPALSLFSGAWRCVRPLPDGEPVMKTSRTYARRSFLSMVAGGAAVGPLALVSGPAEAQSCSDSDPISNGGDPGGRGRNCTNRPQTGCSDRDPTDPTGSGRNCTSQPQTGCSDSDPTDPSRSGRNCVATGCSDSDPTDRSGSGRNCGGTSRGQDVYQTGRRERRYQVCWVDHPSRTNDECNMQTYSEWAITYSDGHTEYDTAEAMRRRAEMEARGYTARYHQMIVDW